MILLELNDAELGLYRDGRPIYRQPAIAHVGAEQSLFGLEALRITRLHPQQANQQYLARLNADPLPVPGKQAANHADLVYLHLLELKACMGGSGQGTAPPAAASRSSQFDGAPRKRGMRLPWTGRRRESPGAPHGDGTSTPPRPGTLTGAGASSEGRSGAPALIAAVPGSLTADQLGVLLGIAQEAGIDIEGFVDSAVLMASATLLPARCWLLDLHLTRACLTELHAGDQIVQAGVQELPGCGLISCLDGWANLLADRFVQDTRFDPLHAADTEQQLFDQLYNWAQSGRRGEAAEGDFSAEIRHGGHERRVQVPGNALRGKLTQRFQQLAQKLPEGARLLVAPRSAALPGLLPGLAELGIQAESLAADVLERGFARHCDRIAAGQLTLVNRLPCTGVAREPEADARPKATHVLYESRAWPLYGNPFGLPRTGRAGETLERDGRRLQLIAVEPDPDS